MSQVQQPDAESRAIASIPQAVRTVNLSVLISLISLVISLFALFWSVRPARVEPVVSAIFISNEGGEHLSIPLSIVNRGAQPTAVLAAKLYESFDGHESIWNADFTAQPERAIPAITGGITPLNATLWVPFMVPGANQVERVFIFRPIDERQEQLIASGRKISYRVVLLLSGDVEVQTSADVTWPPLTDAVLKQRKGGVGSMKSDLQEWLTKASQAVPTP